MDNIFTLIVIIIAVLSVISKIIAKQKSQQDAKPPGGGGWITKLNAYLTDIQHRIEEQSKASTTGSSGWGRLLDGEEAVRSQTDMRDDSLDDLQWEEEQSPAPPEKKPPVRPVRAPVIQPANKQTIPDRPLRPKLRAQKSSYSRMAGNRADLRRAIVWSEILGPPVALRDQPGDRR